MPFLQILLYFAPPFLLFGILAYFTERQWKAKDAELTLDRVRRIVQLDRRPFDLYEPLTPVDIVRLPWKDGRW